MLNAYLQSCVSLPLFFLSGFDKDAEGWSLSGCRGQTMPNEVTSHESPYILLTRSESDRIKCPIQGNFDVKKKRFLKNVKTILAKRIVKFLQMKDNANHLC